MRFPASRKVALGTLLSCVNPDSPERTGEQKCSHDCYGEWGLPNLSSSHILPSSVREQNTFSNHEGQEEYEYYHHGGSGVGAPYRSSHRNQPFLLLTH